jgi:hypothetical protein
MDYVDTFHPTESNDYDFNEDNEKRLESLKKTDKGYNKIVRRDIDSFKKIKVEFYTSGDTGSNIRDAQTGEYYTSIVGSPDEDLYFKVALANGECKSKNGSNVLFYTSPDQYMNHFRLDLNNTFINIWTTKRNDRLKKLSDINDKKTYKIVVH